MISLFFAKKYPPKTGDKILSEINNSELCEVSENKYRNKKNGKNVLKINLCKLGELKTLTCISFFNEVVPAPTLLGNAEEEVNKASERKKILRNNEVFNTVD